MFFEYDKEMLPLGITLNEGKEILSEDIEKVYVDSSNVKAIWFKLTGNTPGQGILYVEFLSDAVYEYHRVPEWVAEFFIRAPSKGRYLWREWLRSLMVTLR